MGLRVLAAMSGGVPTRHRGGAAGRRRVSEVTGVHLALSSNPQSYRTGARGCCTIEDARDARRAADVIGIPFYVWDMAERFARDVVDDFVAEYAAGRTPNPCLRCNEKIKFAAVLDRALALGFDAVCTGHYARIDAASGALQRAVDPSKDQSYVLAVLNKEQIAHALFPLGDTPKSEVREWPASRGLLVADKPDSHDVCFIADGDTRGFLSRKLGATPGEIVDTDGTVLGTHEGAFGFTIGQRKGLRLDPASPRRRAALRAVHRVIFPTSPTVGPSMPLASARSPRSMPGVDGGVMSARVTCRVLSVQLRASHGEVHSVHRPGIRRTKTCTSTFADQARGVAGRPGCRSLQQRHSSGSATISRLPAPTSASAAALGPHIPH